MTTSSGCSTKDLACGEALSGQRVALVGKFAGMSKRDVQQLVRSHGGTVAERADPATTLLVVGEKDLPFLEQAGDDVADAAVREAIDRGTLEVISETQLWQRLGLVDHEQHLHRLYTPAMLAQLLDVPVSVIRRWQRRGWIVPVREVRRLAYFDFQEVATARRLNELLAAGMSPGEIERKLAALARYLPGVERPLAQLSIIVQGKQLLVRQGDELLEAGGQLHFDFAAVGEEDNPSVPASVAFASDVLALADGTSRGVPTTPAEIVQLAGQLEEEGNIEAAAEMYRAAMAAGGPSAELCFLLAELLYQMHDLGAARERYYMAIELDEDYVEARANLGCVLAELGEQELAIAAFQGALLYHDDYPDVHYHLGRILDEADRADEAASHWREFLRLAPTSPWADEARDRLGHSSG